MNLKSKLLALAFVAAVLCAATALTNAAPDAAQTMNSNMQNMNSNMQTMSSSASTSGDIVDKAMADPDLSTLVSLLQTAGLVDTLKGAGPFTVFAPTNEAFAKIPADKLNALKSDPAKLKMVLLYHVLNMSVPASQAKTMPAPTAEGSSLQVKVKSGKNNAAPTVMVDKAMVTQADIMASNGVVHKINSVLMPKMNMKMSNAGMNSNMSGNSNMSMGSNMNSNMGKKGKKMSNSNMSGNMNSNMSNPRK